MKSSGRTLKRFGPHRMGSKTQGGEFDNPGMRSEKGGKKYGGKRGKRSRGRGGRRR